MQERGREGSGLLHGVPGQRPGRRGSTAEGPEERGDRRLTRRERSVYTGVPRGRSGDKGSAPQDPDAGAGAGGARASTSGREQGKGPLAGARSLHSAAQTGGGKGESGRHVRSPPPTRAPGAEGGAGLGAAPCSAPSPQPGGRPAPARRLGQLRALPWRSGRQWPKSGCSCRPACPRGICKSSGERKDGRQSERDDQGSRRCPCWLVVGAPGSAQRARDAVLGTWVLFPHPFLPPLPCRGERRPRIHSDARRCTLTHTHTHTHTHIHTHGLASSCPPGAGARAGTHTRIPEREPLSGSLEFSNSEPKRP